MKKYRVRPRALWASFFALTLRARLKRRRSAQINRELLACFELLLAVADSRKSDFLLENQSLLEAVNHSAASPPEPNSDETCSIFRRKQAQAAYQQSLQQYSEARRRLEEQEEALRVRMEAFNKELASLYKKAASKAQAYLAAVYSRQAGESAAFENPFDGEMAGIFLTEEDLICSET